MKITRLTTSGKAVDAAISPDGKYVAYLVNDSGNQSIRMRQVATGSDTELLPGVPRPRKSLTFTPDGNYLAFLEHHDPEGWAIHRVPALGGVSQRWIEPVSDSPWSKGKEIAFANDGRHVAYIRRLSPDRTALFVSNLETSVERQLATREGALFRPHRSSLRLGLEELPQSFGRGHLCVGIMPPLDMPVAKILVRSTWKRHRHSCLCAIHGTWSS